MISWLVIAILVIIAIIALKMNHLRHRVFIIIIVLIAIFLFISITYVNNKNDLDFSSAGGVLNAGKVYMGWLANSFTNLKAITGNAVKMDWTNTNGTFFNKSEDKAEKSASSAKT
jgi:glucan phosphoethanolaminetransferase (alkaline phosphatase superfamily)